MELWLVCTEGAEQQRAFITESASQLPRVVFTLVLFLCVKCHAASLPTAGLDRNPGHDAAGQLSASYCTSSQLFDSDDDKPSGEKAKLAHGVV